MSRVSLTPLFILSSTPSFIPNKRATGAIGAVGPPCTVSGPSPGPALAPHTFLDPCSCGILHVP